MSRLLTSTLYDDEGENKLSIGRGEFRKAQEEEPWDWPDSAAYREWLKRTAAAKDHGPGRTGDRAEPEQAPPKAGGP